MFLLVLSPLCMVRVAHAQGGCDNDGCAVPTPEIDTTALSPLLGTIALLGGSAVVLRARFRRR